ncbi:hypothetical protein L1D14_07645 [Vibrio tubiashii]|uniref:hypothetical protein n=1 Tax=Vibrio tubiashii TaxID=29498 RepID=UPI001EFCF1B6|nr:hypothetical protein [Vibrio tubiashii]MCG9576112.1 hypothetical protein [Vibrio tubiashii]
MTDLSFVNSEIKKNRVEPLRKYLYLSLIASGQSPQSICVFKSSLALKEIYKAGFDEVEICLGQSDIDHNLYNFSPFEFEKEILATIEFLDRLASQLPTTETKAAPDFTTELSLLESIVNCHYSAKNGLLLQIVAPKGHRRDWFANKLCEQGNAVKKIETSSESSISTLLSSITEKTVVITNVDEKTLSAELVLSIEMYLAGGGIVIIIGDRFQPRKISSNIIKLLLLDNVTLREVQLPID